MVELKRKVHPVCSCPPDNLNRTIVELKQLNLYYQDEKGKNLNRTIVELKHDWLPDDIRQEYILIVP